MSDERLLALLTEIRDNQREALERQSAQLEVAQRQFDQSRSHIEESLRLQREAVRRERAVTLVAGVGIAACLAAIAYLVLRYF